MKVDPKRVAEASDQLRASLNAFIERAALGDVKGMLERALLVQEQLQRVTEIVTNTEVPR